MPEFTFEEDTQEDYDKAGEGNWITFPDSDAMRPGAIQEREIEVTDCDWESVGSSVKILVQVTEEVDFGKEGKFVFGIKKNPATGKSGLFKAKPAYKALTGEDMPFDSKGNPQINPVVVIGKVGVGRWTIQKGTKGGLGEEETYYPKLTDILAPGSKTQVESLV